MKDLETIKTIILEQTIALSETSSDDKNIRNEINKSNALSNTAKTYLNAINIEIKLKDAKRTLKSVK